MTVAEAFFNSVMFAGAAVATLWFFRKAWPAYCTDVFRHRCFELRERLFWVAADGRIEFSDPIYLDMRNLLNRRLKLAHRDTLGGILAAAIAVRGKMTTPAHPIVGRIAELDDESLRNELQTIYWAIVQATITHIFVRSPLILAIASIVAPIVLLLDVLIGGLRVQRNIKSTLVRITSDDREMISSNHDRRLPV